MIERRARQVPLDKAAASRIRHLTRSGFDPSFTRPTIRYGDTYGVHDIQWFDLGCSCSVTSLLVWPFGHSHMAARSLATL